MGGHAYGEDEPTKPCPYCGTECSADFVDVGIGYTQCGPFHCEKCGASEIGPCDKERPLEPREVETGWYKPGAEPGSSANVIGGKIVGHKEMKETYQANYPESASDEWWEEIRKKFDQIG